MQHLIPLESGYAVMEFAYGFGNVSTGLVTVHGSALKQGIH